MRTQSNQDASFIRKHWGKILIGGFVGAAMIAALQERQEQPAAMAASKNIQLSPQEHTFINLILKDEAATAARNGETLASMQELGFSSVVKASALARAYHDNEVAADNQYKSKQLIVDGIIVSIDKDFLDNPILRLRGNQMFMDVIAYMSKSELQSLADMKKGQAVTISCVGGGMVIGSAVLKGCRSAQDEIFDRLMKRVALVMEGRDKTETGQNFVATLLYGANNLKSDSICWSNAKSPACIKEIQALYENPARDSEITKIKLRF